MERRDERMTFGDLLRAVDQDHLCFAIHAKQSQRLFIVVTETHVRLAHRPGHRRGWSGYVIEWEAFRAVASQNPEARIIQGLAQLFEKRGSEALRSECMAKLFVNK